MMKPVAAHPNEKTAQLVWTAFILMFFLIQAVIWTIAITVTARDSSHSVVEGYDELALKWDEVKKMQLDSANLGWTCDISIGETADVLGNRNVTLKLQDRDQSPIQDALVELTVFHRAQAAKKRKLDLIEIGPGTFSTVLRVTKSGKWQFSGKAVQKDQTYLIEQILTINKAAGQ